MIEYFKPIPPSPSIEGWKLIKIKDNNEKLVEIMSELFSNVIIDCKYSKQLVNGAIDKCYVRESVYKLLCDVSEILPQKYKLIVWDAWRPIEVQQALFDSYLAELKKSNPNLLEVELSKIAQRFVSLPSLDKSKPSPHNTGGAIDLSILDENGCELPMGTTFDDFSDKAKTRYYEEKLEIGEKILPNEEVFLNNRRLLYNIMTEIGFTNYPYELWHFDYGNQFWGKCTNNIALYGMTKL